MRSFHIKRTTKDTSKAQDLWHDHKIDKKALPSRMGDIVIE